MASATSAVASRSGGEPDLRQRSSHRRFLLLVAACYLPLLFLGYGTDSDTYATLEMGRHLRATGQYVPSRDPGYPLFELVLAAVAPAGGALLANALSLLLGLWSLRSFLGLARICGLRRPVLTATVLAVHPVFVIAATSSHDYIWALAFLLAATLAAARGRPRLAGLWGGLAVASRLQSAPVVAVVLLAGLLRDRDRKPRWLLGGALAVLLAAVAYSLPAASAGWSAAFVRVGMGPEQLWSPLLRCGRFAYKNLALWGLPAALVLGALLARGFRAGRAEWRRTVTRPVIGVALLAILVTEVVFWFYPIEKEYLLPVVPFLVLVAGCPGAADRRRLLLLAVAVGSLNLVDFNLARPDAPHAATSARIGLWIERGDLLPDIKQRYALRRVDTMEGYVDSLRAFRERNGLGPSRELEALAQPSRRPPNLP